MESGPTVKLNTRLFDRQRERTRRRDAAAFFFCFAPAYRGIVICTTCHTYATLITAAASSGSNSSYRCLVLSNCGSIRFASADCTDNGKNSEPMIQQSTPEFRPAAKWQRAARTPVVCSRSDPARGSQLSTHLIQINEIPMIMNARQTYHVTWRKFLRFRRRVMRFL